jgi:transcriptional regulator with XRE-family HTH domain
MSTAHFSRNLAQWREWRGMKMRELGRASGVSASLISAIESGNRSNPELSTVYKLAQALGLRPEVLVKQERRQPQEERDRRIPVVPRSRKAGHHG